MIHALFHLKTCITVRAFSGLDDVLVIVQLTRATFLQVTIRVFPG